MTVLVTGVAGFIGFHVSNRLLQLGHEVVGCDSLTPYYDPRLKLARLSRLHVSDRFQFFQSDLAEATSLGPLFKGIRYDTVIHLAAQAGVRHSIDHPETYVQSNLVGFANILEACRRHKIAHLIYASSSSVYGLNATTPFSTRQNVDHPASLYAATKKANELMAHSYSHLFNIPTTGLRFFTVYGPWGRPDMAYFKFTKAILTGEVIDVYNFGDLWRDFTYIDDVVEGIVRLLNFSREPGFTWDPHFPDPASSSAPFRVYNIGNHRPIKVTDFISHLEHALGKKARLRMMPMQDGDVLRTCANTDSLREETGFEPNTDIVDGICEFVRWYRSYYQ